ncbi:MAG: N-ethylammeline chlorohydrolase, partial [Kiloniellales bacterium]|nr:N-ethylammeline chlorohydrolase [Kiloniellales bacterium]
MDKPTVFRDVSWIVSWDRDKDSHSYIKDSDFVFQGDRIVQVGGKFESEGVIEINGAGLMIMPGLINIHSHPLSEPLSKGFGEDTGNPKLGMSGLYDYMPVYGPDLDDMATCAEVAYAELLLSGVTTLADLSIPYPGWLDLLSQSGLRGIVAP